MVQAAMAANDKQPLQPSKKKTCTGFCCCKLLVVIYGFFFLSVGLLLLGIGIWVESIKRDYESINDMLTSPSILVILIGGIMAIFSFCGILGAIKEHVCLLRTFLVIIIIVFLLQVVVGILAFVYRERTAKLAGSELEFAIKEYHEDLDLQWGVNMIQRKFSCCGLLGPPDWETNEQYACSSDSPYACSLPASCCKEGHELGDECGFKARSNYTTNHRLRQGGFNTRGCQWYFLEWVEEHLDAVGATALGFAIPQILGMYLVYVFAQKVYDRRYLFKYRKRAYDQGYE